MPRLFAALRPVTLLAAIPLAACVAAPPSGPTVVAMPRSGESLSQFQADDLACRNYAQIRTAPPGATQAAANRVAAGSAVVGTAVGAAAGALLGAAAGNAGAGAAIGAGAGLLTGSAVGATACCAACCPYTTRRPRLPTPDPAPKHPASASFLPAWPRHLHLRVRIAGRMFRASGQLGIAAFCAPRRRPENLRFIRAFLNANHNWARWKARLLAWMNSAPTRARQARPSGARGSIS